MVFPPIFCFTFRSISFFDFARTLSTDQVLWTALCFLFSGVLEKVSTLLLLKKPTLLVFISRCRHRDAHKSLHHSAATRSTPSSRGCRRWRRCHRPGALAITIFFWWYAARHSLQCFVGTWTSGNEERHGDGEGTPTNGRWWPLLREIFSVRLFHQIRCCSRFQPSHHAIRVAVLSSSKEGICVHKVHSRLKQPVTGMLSRKKSRRRIHRVSLQLERSSEYFCELVSCER